MQSKRINKISELISSLQNDTAKKELVWFRGHAIENWKLIPVIFRGSFDKEINYIHRFQQDASILVKPKPTTKWEWLFIMRHYKAPTRLLDWTESPLVAIYFAVTEHLNLDGAIWILDPLKLNTHGRYMDHPTRLPGIEDEIMSMYEPMTFSMSSSTPALPIAFISPRNTQRMQSQLSVFTINHGDRRPMEDLYPKDCLFKYIIPKEAKKTISKELDLLMFSKFQIYPELESIASKFHVGGSDE